MLNLTRQHTVQIILIAILVTEIVYIIKNLNKKVGGLIDTLVFGPMPALILAIFEPLGRAVYLAGISSIITIHLINKIDNFTTKPRRQS